MEVKKNIEIARQTADVWDVLAHRFSDVHLWRSDVSASSEMGKAKLLNVDFAGRVLVTTQGEVEEVLSSYDAIQRSLSYRTSDGLANGIRKVSTTWSLKRTPKGDTEVTVVQNVHGRYPSKLFLPFKRKAFEALLEQQLIDLKCYLESR